MDKASKERAAREPVKAPDSARARDHEIVKASVIGIVGNMLLVVFKLIVGFVSHSIAIILDGVNNATDALSSIITIVGTKLAGRRPDKNHPFGYGRVEYLTSVVIAVIILVAGVISLRESILKIIHPGTPTYSAITITVIIVAILAKVVLGIVFKRYGDKTKSEALIASGIDSDYDAVLSAGTLVVAIVQNVWGLNIDGFVGIIISVVVCKAGIEVLRDALAPIIGSPEDKELVASIRKYILAFPEVHDVHDVILDNFGPNKVIGSVHIKVSDTLSAREVGELSRQITKGLKEKFCVDLTVGIYTENTTDEYAPMKEELDAAVKEHKEITGVHAFYVDPDTKKCYFDLVMDVEADGKRIEEELIQDLHRKHPDYSYDVQIDTDYTE